MKNVLSRSFIVVLLHQVEHPLLTFGESDARRFSGLFNSLCESLSLFAAISPKAVSPVRTHLVGDSLDCVAEAFALTLLRFQPFVGLLVEPIVFVAIPIFVHLYAKTFSVVRITAPMFPLVT